MTSILDILQMEVDQGTGGYELTIKTVKKRTQVDNLWFQEVTFTDGKHEILGDIKFTANVGLTRNAKIRIIVGCRAERDKNNKSVPCLYVDQWADASPLMSEPGLTSEAEEWYAARQKEIEGKCRYGVVCAIIQSSGFTPNAEQKEAVNKVVDFIMTGK